MPLVPFLNCPLTDVTGGMMNHQSGECAKFELRFVECIEAYGVTRGSREQKCKDLFDDLKECESKMKQARRVEAMQFERHRQLVMGERTLKDHYAPGPTPDSSYGM